MDPMIIISVVITFIFFIAKMVEMRYLDKEPKPLKDIVRDTIIIFCSSLLGSFIYFNMNNTIKEFFNIVTETKTLNPETTMIFTDSPGF
uniref:Uncharacterized protein n=1 Tax=viral metagenome TaxID=1070528 RepID=A0A6C0DSE2_9ZZZZ